MKKLFLFITILCFACGGSESPAEIEKPVAANDTATTLENTAVTIDVLANDRLNNNASLSSFDATATNGGTIVNTLNKLKYTPESNFTGTDTFTYTICDGFSTPNCDTATVTVTVNDEGNPTAVNDNYEVEENATIILSAFLDNDTTVDGAALTSIDLTGTTGTAVLDIDEETITYTAQNGFAGTDTFTYTICDNDATPTCSTATITMTVLDEGNPTVSDDEVVALKNQTTIFDNLLANDALIDDAVLASVDDTNTTGNVVLNNDSTVTYTPTTDFEGTDSFSYTVCDDDSPNNTCAIATVTITVAAPINFNIPSEISSYYNGVSFITDSNLMFEEISDHTVVNHTTILSYGQRHEHLYNADEDLNNADNVILMYSGESRYWEEYTSNSNPYAPQTFNTEHVYPQSLLNAADAVTDLHHLRVCDAAVNSARLNYPFADGSGTYKLEGETWYPGDEWKGDVARMMMYLNIRYGEAFNSVGSIELFIQWNIEDPVSPFEEQRNTVIYAAQGNRNPFIDNPYLATLIWGGNDAENKWE
ncbi:Ig-like domain-containing protein [Aestuariivivens sediminicola]|uniref:Ig-like domain-containing protein n=1 Tax=Aestuariivivens sediminicola TaxID=2913560 RepID=UPI001F5AFCB2|nr:Ig-like domain-containing protein [Aestuariivivens sediminicola]